MAPIPSPPLEVSWANHLARKQADGSSVNSPELIPYTARSTLAELPDSSVVLDGETPGEQLGSLFSERPELPGVILFDQDHFTGVISQAHFYKCMSRAFGREIYYRRPASIMLAEMTESPLTLPGDCRIQTAVEHCLARPLEEVYEPFLIYLQDLGQYRLCAFQVLLLASTQIASLRNQQMERILTSVTDGLLVIDRNYRIDGEYSRAVGLIFERAELSETSLVDLLRPLIDATILEQLEEYLRILFDPKLIDRLIKSINPAKQLASRFPASSRNPKEHTKHLAFHFERIRAQGEISQILVRVEDITQRMNLTKELEKQEAAAEEKLQLVMQILQIEPTTLHRFMDRFSQDLSEMILACDLREPTQDVRELVHSLFRKAHTLKGESALLRLTTHERYLHQLEDRLEKLRSSPHLQACDLTSLGPPLETLQNLAIQLEQALDQLKYLHPDSRARQTALTTPALISPPPADLIQTLDRQITDLNAKLNKTAIFHSAVQHQELPPEYLDTLGEVLLHLTRNSMAHGIERIEERVARGKSQSGMIHLAMKTHPEFHEIIFQDDGGGLNYDRIRLRSQELGWNLTTEEELRHAIFEPGFSTAPEVTELSGRGVGLDAIRTALKKVGGSIIPHSETGAYCAFQIFLPRLATSEVAA